MKVETKCALIYLNYTMWIYFSDIYIVSELISVIFATKTTLNESQKNVILGHCFHFGIVIISVKRKF